MDINDDLRAKEKLQRESFKNVTKKKSKRKTYRWWSKHKSEIL